MALKLKELKEYYVFKINIDEPEDYSLMKMEDVCMEYAGYPSFFSFRSMGCIRKGKKRKWYYTDAETNTIEFEFDLNYLMLTRSDSTYEEYYMTIVHPCKLKEILRRNGIKLSVKQEMEILEFRRRGVKERERKRDSKSILR